MNWDLLKRIAFERTGGHYLFWTSAIYLAVGMYCVFVNNFVPVELAQLAWLSVLCLPFAVPPLGRWLNMNITWDQNMIKWFSKDKTPDNVIKFPDPKETPKMPYTVPPTPSTKDQDEHYRVGFTNDGRTTLTLMVGNNTMTLTMNQSACEQMIRMLRSTYTDQSNDQSDDLDQAH